MFSWVLEEFHVLLRAQFSPGVCKGSMFWFCEGSMFSYFPVSLGCCSLIVMFCCDG